MNKIIDVENIESGTDAETGMIQELLEETIPGLRFSSSNPSFLGGYDEESALYGNKIITVNQAPNQTNKHKANSKQVMITSTDPYTESETVAYLFSDPFKAVCWVAGRLGINNNPGQFEAESLVIESPNNTMYLGFEEELTEGQRRIYKAMQSSYGGGFTKKRKNPKVEEKTSDIPKTGSSFLDSLFESNPEKSESLKDILESLKKDTDGDDDS